MYGKAPETQQLLDLTRLASVRISQRVEKLELFTGFESANRYDVLAQDGTTIAHAAESTSGMQRFFLGSGRFESIDLLNASGQRVLSLKETWGFPFSTHHVTTSDGQPIFTVKQQFAFFSRKFGIWGDGMPDIRVKGPIIRPWTFWAYEGERLVGKITKRYSGIGKEIMTDADNFDVEFFGPIANQQQRMRLLVMGFVVDMKFFENKNNSRSGIRIGN
jgi:uncharacterized protein YxjI